MKRAIAAAVVLPVILLLNLSCGNSDDSLSVSTPGVPNVVLPLQVGNTWVYRRSSYDTLGSVIALDTLTERVARDTLIQGEQWYIWETTYGLSMGTTRSDGYWTLVGGVPALTFRYPVALNDTYMITTTGSTVRILALDTLIPVPYGTISCIAYEQLTPPDQRRNRIDFCAANTGLIRTDEFVHTAGGGDSLDRRSDLIDLVLH
jgi:hypothetical protein